MYEYAPKFTKVKEKIILGVLLAVAIALYAVSQIPGILFVAVYQLLAIFCLVGVVMITTRCLMRSYSYAILPRDGGDEAALPDFTVTETYGRKTTVVCRIGVEDIRRVTRITRQNKKELSQLQKRKQIYYYTAQILPEKACLVEAEENEERIFLHICADEGLFESLRFYAEQYLTDL